jgi:hypothetical protein
MGAQGICPSAATLPFPFCSACTSITRPPATSLPTHPLVNARPRRVVIQQDDAKKPLPRYEQGAAMLGHTLYVLGGHYGELGLTVPACGRSREGRGRSRVRTLGALRVHRLCGIVKAHHCPSTHPPGW